MTKKEFINELRERLSGLPKEDLENRLSFFEESINDRMDEGKSEEEAIKELGTIDEIVTQVAEETSLVTLVKEKAKPKRRLSVAEIVLVILCFPLWFPLLVTFLVLCLVMCIVFWVLAFVPMITQVSAGAAGVYSIIAYFAGAISGDSQIAMIGMAIAGIGLAIMLIPAVIYTLKGVGKLTKLIMIGIKKAFIRRRK